MLLVLGFAILAGLIVMEGPKDFGDVQRILASKVQGAVNKVQGIVGAGKGGK